MNAIKDTWRQLVRRRLWPVAVLLIAALVAVPMVLAKAPEPPPADPPSAVEKEDVGSSFVTLAQAGETAERRRVLGAEKDPFEPRKLPKAKKSKKKQQDEDKPAEQPKPKADKPADKGSGGGGAAPAPPKAPEPTATPVPTAPAGSVRIRFGTTEGDPTPAIIERLSVLPDEENPVVVYRGTEKNGKVAVFELTGVVQSQGDAECLPSPEDCQTIKLRAGETQFITVSETGETTDAQYQLDVVKIFRKKTKLNRAEIAELGQPKDKS